MGSISDMEIKPHAVCIPFPTQGDINAMLKVAKILHCKANFHITFVNTEFNHKRLLKSRGPDSLNGSSSFKFRSIPDGLPPSDVVEDSTQDITALCESTTTTCIGPFRDLISQLNDTPSSGVPPVSCIVSDACMSFTLDVAEELGIPEVILWTISGCACLGYMNYAKLVEKGLIPIKDENYLSNGYLEQELDWIPAMKGIRLKNLPTFLRTTDPNDYMLKYLLQETERSKKASAIILNTTEELERDVINSLSSILPPIYAIGPLNIIQKKIVSEEMSKIKSNLWKEEPECLEWLDTKESNSVIYVNFGSIAVMTSDQMVEFAWGLANSKQQFLWIIRSDVVTGESAVLPPEFMEEIKDRGFLAGWCPQEQVLNHPAIGGFLTHNGWNSTLESISFGVPMISWPFFADQQTNSWFCWSKWGIGMEINSDVKRDEVENLVKELMVGVKGKEMKKKAMEWKKVVTEATQPDGSSFSNLEMVIKVLCSPRKEPKQNTN